MINDFLQLLFPRICACCDQSLIDTENVICLHCLHDLPLTNDYTTKDFIIKKALRGRLIVEKSSSLFYYEKASIVQALIHDLKYRGNEKISPYLGYWHAELLKSVHWNNNIEAVIPVPVSKVRLKKRGFNQVQGYAKAFAEVFDIPLIEDVLWRASSNSSQVFKGRLARTAVIDKNYFAKNLNKIQGKHILVVDDLMTTGATLEACGNVLKEAKDIKISVATMAIVA
ncbi:ComF family protein [Psychroflexus maritimus]|uniref:ComF family protein n=1 Tax=Psychroflexus maritimus TaxID=2714865 RepID=A0A967E6U3_9FLAO|nr:phosphoribosyltransferase family protein [Psychroflexus maritimus]NGZ90096.1 ComF family protein [Psychroflexus maritimus]